MLDHTYDDEYDADCNVCGGIREAEVPAAEVNGEKYETFADAYAAANAGDVITLYKDISTNTAITINKSITINGNGNALNSSAAQGIIVSAAGVELTINKLDITAMNNAIRIESTAVDAKIAITDSDLTGLSVVNVRAENVEVTINGGSVTCNDQNTYENYGALTIAATGKNAKIIATGVTLDIKDDSYKGLITATGGVITIDGSDKDVQRDVAIIEYAGGGIYSFATLQEAVDYAKPGETVKLIADVEIKTSIKITNTVVVDLNGYTLTGPDDGKANWYAFIVDGGDLTLKDSTGAGQLYAKCYGVETKSGTFTLDGAKIVATKNGTVGTAIVNFGGTVIVKSGFASGANDAVYTGGYFSDATTTILDGTIEGTVSVEDWEAKDFAESVTSASNTYATSEDYKWVEKDGAYVLTAKTYVAQVGDKKFETLAEAVAAAKDDETVKLLKSVEGSGIVIDKDITIDFGGNTYTFTTPAVGSTGTTTLGFQILQGNEVTLTNGRLQVSAAYDKSYAVLIQNYADLTITDMVLDGTQLDRFNGYDYSYVVSVNCGTVLIENTEIIGNDEGVAYALLADKYSTYAVPNVTVANVTVTGLVKVGGGNLTIESGSFKGNGSNGLVRVDSGNLTINGGTFEATLGEDMYSMAVWAKGGNTVIKGGTFKNATDGTERGTDLIYASVNGAIVIEGGVFEAATPAWTLNCNDGDYKAGKVSISVSGGQFKDFDPADNKTEGEETNFLADTTKHTAQDDEGYFAICEGTYTSTVTDPTCTEQGYTTHTCSACPSEYVDTYVDAINHANAYAGEAKDATCTEDGHTAGIFCPDCNEWIDPQTPIKGGHDFSVFVRKVEPTNTITGYTLYKCANCDETEVRDKVAAFVNAVAEFEEKYYETFEDALTAAKASESNEKVITMLKYTSDALYIDADVIVDFNHRAYTFNTANADGAAITIAEGATVTLRNGTIQTRFTAKTLFNYLIVNNGTLTTQNVTLRGDNLYADGTTATIVNNNTLSLEAGTVVVVRVSGLIADTTVTTTKDASVALEAPENCDWENDTTLVEHTHKYVDEVVEPNFERSGYTKHTCKCGYSYIDNIVYAPVAYAVNTSTGVQYTTLAQAVAEAGKDETVKLLKKQTGAALVFNADNVTVNFNGNVYTVNDDEGKAAVVIAKDQTVNFTNGDAEQNGMIQIRFTYRKDFNCLVNNQGTLNVDSAVTLNAANAQAEGATAIKGNDPVAI